MSSSYTSNLRLVLPVTGELSGTWGDTVNTGLTELTDASISGTATITMTAADYTLSTANGATDEARNMFLSLQGTPGASYNVIVPAVSKLYYAYNNTGFAQTVKTAAGAGFSVPNGSIVGLYCNGTTVVRAGGDVTLDGTQTLTNKTLTSPTIATPTLTGPTINDGYTEEVLAISGTTPAITPTTASIQTWTLTGNSTPTAGTWAAGQSLTLMIDDGTAYTVTWTSMPVTWKTGLGTAPSLNTTGFTAITFWKVGSIIYGARVGDA